MKKCLLIFCIVILMSNTACDKTVFANLHSADISDEQFSADVRNYVEQISVIAEENGRPLIKLKSSDEGNISYRISSENGETPPIDICFYRDFGAVRFHIQCTLGTKRRLFDLPLFVEVANRISAKPITVSMCKYLMNAPNGEYPPMDVREPFDLCTFQDYYVSWQGFWKLSYSEYYTRNGITNEDRFDRIILEMEGLPYNQ